MTIAELGIDTTPHIEVLSVDPPPEKTPGPLLPDVDSLIAKLKELKFI